MNDIGVIGGADGATMIVTSSSIAVPIIETFFAALTVMLFSYFAFYRRGTKGKAFCLALVVISCVVADQVVRGDSALPAAASAAHARTQLRRSVVELFGREVAAHRADGGGHVRDLMASHQDRAPSAGPVVAHDHFGRRHRQSH